MNRPYLTLKEIANLEEMSSVSVGSTTGLLAITPEPDTGVNVTVKTIREVSPVRVVDLRKTLKVSFGRKRIIGHVVRIVDIEDKLAGKKD